MTDTNAISAAAADTQARMDAAVNYVLHHAANSTSWKVPGLFNVEFLLPTFTLHALMLLIVAGLMVLTFGFLYQSHARVPSGLTNLMEIFVVYIRDDICVSFLGEEDGKRFTPLFCSFFFFILFLNLLGLVPVFASATGNISVTMALAAITFFFMTIGAMMRNGPLGFFRAMAPHGVPWPVLIMLVPIEFIGVFIKAMALMIRLFANMMAGHIVIGALISLVVVYGAMAAPALVLAFGIFFLKIFVSLLQAYIFTLLSAMFIGMMYHPSH